MQFALCLSCVCVFVCVRVCVLVAATQVTQKHTNVKTRLGISHVANRTRCASICKCFDIVNRFLCVYAICHSIVDAARMCKDETD